MNAQCDVSIIIVSYNIFAILDDCLKSIIEYSSGFTYEIIVVDNKSTDGSVDSVTDKYECVRLIKNNENRGFAAANNQGIEIARGRFVLVLNNDTLFTENCVAKIIDFCNTDKLVTESENYFIGCRLDNSDGSRQVSLFDYDSLWNSFTENFFLYMLFPKSRFFNKYYYNYIDIQTPMEVEAVKGAFIFAPAETVKKLGGFDERFFFYFEETDLCYRLKKIGGKVIYYPYTSIIHLGGLSSGEIPWFSYKNQGMAKIQFYQKHFRGLKFFLAVLLRYTGLLMRIPIYFLSGLMFCKKSQFYKSFYFFRQMFCYPKNLFK